MTTEQKPLRTLADIRERNREYGRHFFDPSTLRFFRSRICGGAFPLADGSALFVTSERFVTMRGEAAPRRYTVRRALAEGDIVTVGGFQAYGRRTAAFDAVRKMAAAGAVPSDSPWWQRNAAGEGA